MFSPSLFFPQNNMCIFISQSGRFMEQDKLSLGFSSGQSALSLTDSSFIHPLSTMRLPHLVSLFLIAPNYRVSKILGNARDKYYFMYSTFQKEKLMQKLHTT